MVISDHCKQRRVEGVLESDRILRVLNRNIISSHMGPSIDGEAGQEAKSKEQADGRLHPGKRVGGRTMTPGEV